MSDESRYVENDLDTQIARFDSSWRSGETPEIDDYLSKELPARDLLVELVMVDLEYRWRNAPENKKDAATTEQSEKICRGIPMRPRLDDYVAAYPELGPLERLPAKLIADEYRVRHRWGDRPSREAYSQRFPNHGRALQQIMQHVDERLPHSTGDEGLQIRCPHCHVTIDVEDLDLSSSIVCASCDGTFSFLADELGAGFNPGRKIGSFQLVECLGTGSFGMVWKARDTELDRDVAVKIPHRGQLLSPQVEQFLREARVAAQLNHPNIVGVHEIGRESDTIFIVSDLVNGKPLSEWQSDRRFTVREAAQLCETIARALHHAHQAGVIHRDLKPHNIIIDSDGQPYLTDFGLARHQAGGVTMTCDGQLLGTPAYMSPEQAKGEAHHADQRSDVYSLGVILYELLTGEAPFRGSVRVLLHQVINDDAPSPRRLNSNIPRDLETICLKCLEKDAAKRYASAHELADELHRFLSGKPIHARPVSAVARTWRWGKRNPLLATFAVTAASLLLFLGVAGPMVAINQQSLASREITTREQINRLLYISDIKVAHQAWESANVGQVATLLKRHLPQSDREDLRGFEWFYLWQLCRESEAPATLPFVAPAHIAYSPDGKILVAGGRTTLKLWRMADASELLKVEAHRHLIKGLVFSPNGQLLATGDWRGVLKLWQWDGEHLRQLGILSEDREMVYHSLAFSPDGQLLATNGRGSEVPVWELVTRTRRVFNGHTDAVICVAISRDSVLASGGKDSAVRLWDIKSGLEKTSPRPSGDAVDVVAFSPDGATLASGSRDGMIELWDASTGGWKCTLRGHTNSFTGLVFSPDGNLLASSNEDGTVKLWDLSANELVATLRGHSGMVNHVAFSPDGQTLASAGLDGNIRLWGIPMPAPRDTLNGNRVEFSSSDGTLMSWTGEGLLRVWDTATGQPSIELNAPDGGCVARSPDGKSLSMGYPDGTVEVRVIETGRKYRSTELHDGPVHYVVFSPCGKILASVGGHFTGHVLKLWDVDTLKPLADLEVFWGARPAFTPDGTTLATVSEDQATIAYSIRLWDLTNVESGIFLPESSTLVQQDTPFFSLAFSADNGAMLAAGDLTGEIKIWNVRTNQSPRTLKAHTSNVYSLAFSPDNTRLVSSSKDRTVKLWDLATDEEVITLKGHRGTVLSVAFSLDGRTLASASEENVVKLWRAATEAQVRAAGW